MVYLALRQNEMKLDKWHESAVLRVRAMVILGEETRQLGDTVIELDSEKVKDQAERVQALTSRDGRPVPSPGRHIRAHDIVLWQISAPWSAPEGPFRVKLDIDVGEEGSLPSLGEWTLRLERFVDAI